jgi:hypothetical protein
MSASINLWWSFLCAVAALNIVAWSLSAVALSRKQAMVPAELYTARRLQLLLSAVYVFGCAFRSVFPVYDVPRICLFDTWVSSVIVGRSVATLAELCFVAQWALMLRETARAQGNTFGKVVSLALVPLIAIAETCSWYSVLTTSNLGHVAEESIWGVCAALLVVSVAMILPRSPATRRPAVFAWCVAGMAYVAYMFLVDVPMYWSRWLADEAGGRQYMGIAQGLFDVAHRRVVSYRWQDWKHEIVWMSLYFSVAVWISISLIRAPAPGAPLAADERKRLPSLARYPNHA